MRAALATCFPVTADCQRGLYASAGVVLAHLDDVVRVAA
jgi:hypothetical protein